MAVVALVAPVVAAVVTAVVDDAMMIAVVVATVGDRRVDIIRAGVAAVGCRRDEQGRASRSRATGVKVHPSRQVHLPNRAV